MGWTPVGGQPCGRRRVLVTTTFCRIALVAVFAASLLASPLRLEAQEPQDAQAALARVSSLVEAAGQAPEADRAALIAQALAALDGTPALAGNAWLREALAASPPDLARARGRFAAANDAAQSVRPARDPVAALAALDDVLGDPIFQERDWLALLPAWLLPAAIFVEIVLDALWNAVRWPVDRLLDLLTRIISGVLGGPIVIALGVLLIGGLILLYQRGLRSAIVRQAEVARSDMPIPPSASEALGLAGRHAAVGEYREACHFVLLSTLLAIEERGHARFDPAATNREHLARLAGWPPLARSLDRVVGRFDRIWYGQDAVTEADYRDLLSLADGVAKAAS